MIKFHPNRKFDILTSRINEFELRCSCRISNLTSAEFITKSSTWKAPHKHLPEGGTKVNAGLATKSRRERWFADDVVMEDT